MSKTTVMLVLVFLCQATMAQAQDRIRVVGGIYIGKPAEGKERAKLWNKLDATTGVPGSAGSTAGIARQVPALEREEAALASAEEITGIEHESRATSLLHGYSFSITPVDRRHDRIRAEVAFELTQPAKGDDEEHVVATSGRCYRQLGMFPLGKVHKIVGDVDASGNATWVEFAFEDVRPEKQE